MKTLPLLLLSALLSTAHLPAHAQPDGSEKKKAEGKVESPKAFLLGDVLVLKMPKAVFAALRDVAAQSRPVGTIGGKEIRALDSQIKTIKDVITQVTEKGQVTEGMVDPKMRKLLVKLGAEGSPEEGYSFREFLLVPREGFWQKPEPLTIVLNEKKKPYVFKVFPLDRKKGGAKGAGKKSMEKLEEKSSGQAEHGDHAEHGD